MAGRDRRGRENDPRLNRSTAVLSSMLGNVLEAEIAPLPGLGRDGCDARAVEPELVEALLEQRGEGALSRCSAARRTPHAFATSTGSDAARCSTRSAAASSTS